jgi:hypothetical protein
MFEGQGEVNMEEGEVFRHGSREKIVKEIRLLVK